MTGASDEVIRDLQMAVLRSAFTGDELPGGRYRARLPDREFLLQHEVVYVLAQNVPLDFAEQETPIPMRLVERDELARIAGEKGGIGYLFFSEIDASESRIAITLEARITSNDPALKPLGLGGVRVSFRKREGDWEVDEQPVVFGF